MIGQILIGRFDSTYKEANLDYIEQLISDSASGNVTKSLSISLLSAKSKPTTWIKKILKTDLTSKDILTKSGNPLESFHRALDEALENLGPYCYEAVEVDVTLYHDNGDQEARLLFVGPTAQAIHEAQRRCMVEDISALLERQFNKERAAEVVMLVNDLFDRDWKEKAAQPKQPERAFETYTRPSRKHLH